MPDATVAILASVAVLMVAATWLGWMRHHGRIEEIPSPLRGAGAVVALIGIFVAIMLIILAIGVLNE